MLWFSRKNLLCQRQKVDVTESAVEAVMERLCYMAENKKPFDGKAEIEINGFRLSIDCTGNPMFMEKYAESKDGDEQQ